MTETPTKAIVGSIVTFVGTFLAALYATLQGKTDLDNTKAIDWFVIILGALVVALATGGFVYQTTNKPI